MECLFQFVCSSNNHISRIHGMVERLCKAYGTPLHITDKATAASLPEVEPHANKELLSDALLTVHNLNKHAWTVDVAVVWHDATPACIPQPKEFVRGQNIGLLQMLHQELPDLTSSCRIWRSMRSHPCDSCRRPRMTTSEQRALATGRPLHFPASMLLAMPLSPEHMLLPSLGHHIIAHSTTLLVWHWLCRSSPLTQALRRRRHDRDHCAGQSS